MTTPRYVVWKPVSVKQGASKPRTDSMAWCFQTIDEKVGEVYGGTCQFPFLPENRWSNLTIFKHPLFVFLCVRVRVFLNRQLNHPPRPRHSEETINLTADHDNRQKAIKWPDCCAGMSQQRCEGGVETMGRMSRTRVGFAGGSNSGS